MSAPDILKSGFYLPDKVTILGSGPNGKPFYDQLDGFIISVNKAVMFHESDLWLSWAMSYWRYQEQEACRWWKDAQYLDVVKCFGSHPNMGLGDRCACDYSFEYECAWVDAPHGFKRGYLCHGGTISMAALQLCYWLKVKHVTLCGCDFFGCDYADGTIGLKEGQPFRHPAKDGLHWRDIDVANDIVATCRAKGMEIVSISPTSLQV